MLTGWKVPYLLVVLIWGSAFVLIEVALQSFSLDQVAMWRALIGAAFGAAVLVFGGRALPRFTILAGARILVLAGLSTTAYVCAAAAQCRMPSGAVAVVCATTPLLSIVIRRVRGEAESAAGWVGVCLGILGVGVLLKPGGDLDHSAVLLGLVAAACFALAGVLAAAFFSGAQHSGTQCSGTQCSGTQYSGTQYSGTQYSGTQYSGTQYSGTQLTTAQLMASGVGLAVLPPLHAGPASLHPASLHPASLHPASLHPNAVLALLVLGVVHAGLANMLFWRVMRQAGPTIAATTYQAVPVVAVALGVVVLGEPLGFTELVGAALVIAGLCVLTVRSRAKRQSAPTPTSVVVALSGAGDGRDIPSTSSTSRDDDGVDASSTATANS